MPAEAFRPRRQLTFRHRTATAAATERQLQSRTDHLTNSDIRGIRAAVPQKNLRDTRATRAIVTTMGALRGMISAMAGARGVQQRGRSAIFDPDRAVRAAVQFPPGDPDRSKYEALVSATGVSGAEIVRYALRALQVDKDGRPVGWPYAQEVIAEAS